MKSDCFFNQEERKKRLSCCHGGAVGGQDPVRTLQQPSLMCVSIHKCVLGQSVPPESDSRQTTADRVSVDEEKLQQQGFVWLPTERSPAGS